MKPPTIAFQGEEGSYSHEAAQQSFDDGLVFLPQVSFSEVFTVVESGDADFGIVPIENSLVGSIHQIYELLLSSDLKVVGERNLRISHALIAAPGVNLGQIKSIQSHPVALEQCHQFLKSHSGIKTIPAYDTAGSVKALRQSDITDTAAIASRFAAHLYGMNILAEGIQDEPDNFTRFLLLSRKEASQRENCKTSIVFALKNVPGALFKALSVFALRDIDLTRIESRPNRKRAWEYYFYVDFIGHHADATVKNAINHLGEITTTLKILGSYPISSANGRI
jgi:prephenate dehydratase